MEFFGDGSNVIWFSGTAYTANAYPNGYSVFCVRASYNSLAGGNLPTFVGAQDSLTSLRWLSGSYSQVINNADFTYGTGGAYYNNGTNIQSGNNLTLPSKNPSGWTILTAYMGSNTPIDRFMLFGGQGYPPGIRPFTGFLGDMFVILSNSKSTFTNSFQQIIEGYLGYKLYHNILSSNLTPTF